MKNNIIKKHFSSRSKIERALKSLNINSEGSREKLEKELKTLPYKKILSLIEKS